MFELWSHHPFNLKHDWNSVYFWLISMRKIAYLKCLLELNMKCCFHKVSANAEEQPCSKGVSCNIWQRPTWGNSRVKQFLKEAWLSSEAPWPPHWEFLALVRHQLLAAHVITISEFNSVWISLPSFQASAINLLSISFLCISQKFLAVLKPNPSFPNLPM